jgi:N-acetyltransferase
MSMGLRGRVGRNGVMIACQPVILSAGVAQLEPLGVEHAGALAQAVEDGQLWRLWYTATPSPQTSSAYVEAALRGQQEGHMLPWVVRHKASGVIIGSTRFHDIVPEIGRVEIGYTWYGASFHRTAVNTGCKLALLQHAFESLQCSVVGFRTDGFNFASQRAIERLGAKKDGIIRRHQPRKDGSVRDSVMYSILVEEWPDIKRHLQHRLERDVA